TALLAFKIPFGVPAERFDRVPVSYEMPASRAPRRGGLRGSAGRGLGVVEESRLGQAVLQVELLARVRTDRPATEPTAPRARIRFCRRARPIPRAKRAARRAEVRSIGIDVHRSFAQIAIVKDGICHNLRSSTAEAPASTPRRTAHALDLPPGTPRVD